MSTLFDRSERRDAGERDGHDETVAEAPEPTAATFGINPYVEFTPQAAVDLLRRRPDLQREIFVWMHRTLGAAFVQRVIAASKTAFPPAQDPGAPELSSMSSLAGSDDLATAGSPSTGSATRPGPGEAKVDAAAPSSTAPAPSSTVEPAPAHADGDETAQASAVDSSPPPVHADAQQPVAATAGDASASTHAASQAAPAPRPDAARAPADAEFTTLTGNAVAKTIAKEAALLNALRADLRRFDPAWLAVAQRALGVLDATGGMNTETLRAMRIRSGDASLGTAGIMDRPFLAGIAPGEPFLEPQLGFADHAADPAAETPADRAAQAVGYASYREYRKGFVTITFLGRPMAGQGSGEGHPYLAARIKAAESFLRQRHPGPDGDEGVIKSIGWNGVGNISYADKVGTPFSHQHTMGLAVDIDPAHNPYLFNETATGLPHDQAMWWIETFEEMFRVATRIYGGEPISPAVLMDWSRKGSTEELFLRVQATSNAFRQYLELSKKPKEEILAALTKAGYGPDEAEAQLPEVQKAEGLFHKGSRQHAKTITNIHEELLVALRDVAGLSWGGTEMSMRENGDFMHFDCRDTEFGRAVYSKKAPGKKP